MRGQKECIEWMIENEGAKIHGYTGSANVECWYIQGEFRYRIEQSDSYSNILNFNVFEYGDWDEVVESITFEEAREECKKTGDVYVGVNDDNCKIFLNTNNEVCVGHNDGWGVNTEQMWIKETE